jgi:hydrogenase/urease accessory protein HupE
MVAALPLCALAVASSAVAHPLSASYAHVAVGDTGIILTVRLPLDDMDLLLRMDRDLDGTVSDQEIQDTAPALVKYVSERVRMSADGRTRTAAAGRTQRWADSAGVPYVETVIDYPGDGLPSRLSLQIKVLADLYIDHRTLTDIEWNGRREQFVFQHANTFDATSGSSDWWARTWTFLVLGFEHILTGYDHLLFLLGLLVAGRGVRELVAIVTSFTIAHSLTLGVATFGLVNPPARAIEAVIALSIAYVGIENLVRREPRGRWKLTFGFGLVHGFGFANVLREMQLPREALAASLFTFNAGVEVGQLAVVLIAWPVLRWIQRSAYTTPVTRWVSAVVTACGLFWFVQRVM